MHLQQPCHCLYSSSIPVTVLGFYLNQLRNKNIHSNIDELEKLLEIINSGVTVDFDKIEIQDPLVLVLISMIEPNCSFQTIMEKVNQRSKRFYTPTTAKIIRNDDEDIKTTIRKYWKPHPEKITKNGSV